MLGKPLDNADKDAFAHHFQSHILDGVRVVMGESIRPLDFAPELRAAGIDVPDLTIAEPTTIDDVIVVNRPLTRATLMHELVQRAPVAHPGRRPVLASLPARADNLRV
jgi:hypothetical protein